MPDITILSERELRAAVQLDQGAIHCIERAFEALATQPVIMPPILRLDIEAHNGEVDVETAYVPGIDSFAIKISPGFFDNPTLGLPSVNGLMVLFSAKTGLVEAVLLDNGYLTDVRTAAAGAVAVKHLSRADSTTAGIIGAGVQAGLQLEALTLVRPIEQALVWARNTGKAAAFAERMSANLGIEVKAVETTEAAVRPSDVVVTTTPSTEPLIRAEWLSPGQHITAMGSDAEHKNELAPAIIAAADRYVCDRREQCGRLGELHHALEADLVDPGTNFPELGEIIAAKSTGRPSADAITVADLTGTGVQDTAIATFTYARAMDADAGTSFSS
ncbi:MAG: cyclodeaminase [Geminicoccaceae bacterium]